jgi:hypothetical protein
MHSRLQVAAVWLVIAGAATYLFLFDPARGTGYPSCPFLTLTGLQCPGCGSTRGLHQLLHGHPVDAFKLNPLVIIAIPIVLLLFASSTAPFGKHLQTKRLFRPWFGWLALAVVVAFWIFRNTRFYPFAS